MKLAYLTEVAALMSAHGQLFIQQTDELPNQVVGDYYILSRNRFNRWMKDLNDIENGISITDPRRLLSMVPGRSITRSMCEQIMINEMLSRIWTLLLIARDRQHGSDQLRPLAHNVFLGHVSIRHKALSICLTDPRVTPRDTQAIDKLRICSERWTDMLCCQLMEQFDLWQYAFDRERAQEFLRDRNDQQRSCINSQAWVLILAGMRHSFPDTDGLAAPISEEDRAILRLILSSFPAEAPEMAFWLGRRLHQARSR